MATSFFAHTPDGPNAGPPPVGWHGLAEHLREVARLAERFAREARPIFPDDPETVTREKEAFHLGARWAGLLHDLGKYRPEFQKMLRGLPAPREQTWHKQAGAARAKDGGRLDVAFAVAGHHGGLPDRPALKGMIESSGGSAVAPQVWPLASAAGEVPELLANMSPWAAGSDPFQLDLLIRLLFSCLVDADWLDTGAFKRRSRGLAPEPLPPPLEPAAGLVRVLAYIEERARNCPGEEMARIRGEILDAALKAAALPPGLFALTVPTGGGKTLSALAFALSHARHHGLRRVIYVAPYLTILEQNTHVLRMALGVKDDGEFVFEHHSLAEPRARRPEDETETEEAVRRAENWQAPVVATTNVQLFESLFAHEPSACRKLHNLGRSVLILDECQTLPPGLVEPTRSMLGQVSRTLGCSIVFCTATQPGWTCREDLPGNLRGVREIVPPELRLFERLVRVRVEWPQGPKDLLDLPDVAGRMVAERAALCVVNTRGAAVKVCAELARLGCPEVAHLSTTMCPAHRFLVLEDVRRRLKHGLDCRLVSTQVIEAGCDVDFPLVLREMAPLEAIIQAAGRCNREGLLKALDGLPGGRVVVFRTPEGRLPSDRWYRAGRDTLERLLQALPAPPDIGRAEDIAGYFARLYGEGKLDEKGIQADRSNQKFPEVAGKYRLIEEDTFAAVVTTWQEHEAEVQRLLDAVRHAPTRRNFRRLAPYQANLRNYERARATGWIIEDACGLKLWTGPYDDLTGLRLEGDLGDRCVV
jgi:CRISPR-associated endonuclease/helicase Cas3